MGTTRDRLLITGFFFLELEGDFLSFAVGFFFIRLHLRVGTPEQPGPRLWKSTWQAGLYTRNHHPRQLRGW